MQEGRGTATLDESPYANFQLPPPRESSRFSTTYSFYEFIEQEMKEEEERDMIILKVRENIIGSLVDELYNRYVDRQVIPFTVRCFLQSLKRVMNWYFLPRDPEDTPVDWEIDEPVPPVPVDNWASYCIPPGEHPPKIKFKFHDPDKPDQEEEELLMEEGLDFSDFEETPDDVDASQWPSRISQEPARLSTESGSGVLDDFDDPGPPEVSGHSIMSPTNESRATSKKRAHFVTQSKLKIKREINQWISPKNFPPVRVNAGLNVLPGEKFSGKTCGRKYKSSKNILIRPTKPTYINAKGSEVKTYSLSQSSNKIP